MNTATTQTVELAKKAQDVFTQVDKSLGIQDARIRNLTEQLADVEAKLSNQ